MMHTKHFAAIFSIIVSIAFCNPAVADLVIDFSIDGGSSFGSEFDLDSRQNIPVSIWARELGPSTDFSSQGLVSFGFDLELLTPGSGLISNPTPNVAFDFEQTNNSSSSGFQWEFAQSASTGVRGESILLGEFQFDPILDGPSVFSLTDRLPGTGVANASWVTSSFAFVDERVFGADAAGRFTLTLNSTAVPEPNSIALLALGTLALTLRRKK